MCRVGTQMDKQMVWSIHCWPLDGFLMDRHHVTDTVSVS